MHYFAHECVCLGFVFSDVRLLSDAILAVQADNVARCAEDIDAIADMWLRVRPLSLESRSFRLGRPVRITLGQAAAPSGILRVIIECAARAVAMEDTQIGIRETMLTLLSRADLSLDSLPVIIPRCTNSSPSQSPPRSPRYASYPVY